MKSTSLPARSTGLGSCLGSNCGVLDGGIAGTPFCNFPLASTASSSKSLTYTILDLSGAVAPACGSTNCCDACCENCSEVCPKACAEICCDACCAACGEGGCEGSRLTSSCAAAQAAPAVSIA